MSLAIVQAENQKHPELLQLNIASTCYQATVNVIAALRAAGHEAYHICKTAGEGQYTPPGFAPRPVVGLDGKTYTCTGVSHDALWCDGKQFDTIASGNDSPDPIFDSNGNRIHGTPVWNEIPQQFWRPQNPPLKDGSTPVPTPQPVIPTYESLGGDAFFRAEIGVPLQADMAAVGQSLNDGSSVWFSRTAHDCIAARFADPKADLAPITKKHRNEWRAVLGLPPL